MYLMVMDDQESSVRVGAEVYLSSKGKAIISRAKAMGQTRANFIGALVERYGETYLAELRKMGIREAPPKKVSNAEPQP